MNRINFERVRIEYHQPEVGFVTTNDRRLQPSGGVRSSRIERGGEFGRTLLPVGDGELLQYRPIKTVIQMGAMPTFERDK